MPLVDLEVIVRYSLAIRQELAPADEVLAVLEESLAHVRALLGLDAGGAEEPEQPQPAGEPPEGEAPRVVAAVAATEAPPAPGVRPGTEPEPSVAPVLPPEVVADLGIVVDDRAEEEDEPDEGEPDDDDFEPVAVAVAVAKAKAKAGRRGVVEVVARPILQAIGAPEAEVDALERPTPMPADEAGRRRAERRARRVAP